MPYPLSLQLYTLREEAKDGNHIPIIKKVAAIGYKGVECAGFYGLKPREYRKLMDDHGLAITSYGGGLPTKEQIAEISDIQKTLGTPHYMCAWLPPEEYASADSIKKLADKVETSRALLEGAGVTLCLHNHDFEFGRLDGHLKFELLGQACPKVQFEIDVYWAANFGAESPEKAVFMFKDRTPLLHIKDGPFTKGAPMVAAGSGRQDFPAIFKAANSKVLKWVVVELDSCATDMVKAVSDSYDYLVGSGLASGNKRVGKPVKA